MLILRGLRRVLLQVPIVGTEMSSATASGKLKALLAHDRHSWPGTDWGGIRRLFLSHEEPAWRRVCVNAAKLIL